MSDREEALAAVDGISNEYLKSRAHHLEVRDRLDKAVMVAKVSGATFRQLANRTKLSVGWVQKSLSRQGYKPSRRSSPPSSPSTE